jgi:predicted Zn finger-like uncharacterized protein
MITTCTDCQARYQLDETKVPKRKIRVRCPACQGVFGLDGTQTGAAVVDPMPAAAPAPEPVAEAPAQDDMVVTSGFESPAAAPPAPEPAAPAASQSDQAQSSVAVLDQVSESTGSTRRRRSKEEMLARALVSDILVYNRELRDKALAEGNLLEALGAEIKKSWELYKEKVTPEVANSTNHFRDALNEILAEGDKVF